MLRQHLSGGSGGSCLGAILGLSRGSIDIVVGLVRAVDGNLDCDLTSLDLLAVHLSNGLLLQLLGRQSDKAEATTLASLAAGLQLLDHKAGDRTQSNLGRRWLVGVEQLLELKETHMWVSNRQRLIEGSNATYLLLGQIVGQVSHHDLGLGGNAVGGRTTLTTLASRASLGLGIGVTAVGLVGDIGQRLGIVGCTLSGTLSALLIISY